jgi:hypothetical protein
MRPSATEQDFIVAIDDIRSSGKDISFAELIAKVWANKVVEIYVGDTYEDIKFEDSTQKYAAVVIGKVITAYAECLVLDCVYTDQRTKEHKFGNLVCLNERAIRTITEVAENGILRETFLNSRDGRIVKKILTGEG